MRLKNKLDGKSLRRIADSLFNSKLRYGIHLCGKIRTQDSDARHGLLDDLQKTQTKLFRLLNNTQICDKINTVTIANNLKMLSVNQINAQIKLTEMWKASNMINYPIILERKITNDGHRSTRSNLRGDIVLQGKNALCHSSFLFDASKNWNKTPTAIKDCTTLYKAKKEIKKYVSSLPL